MACLWTDDWYWSNTTNTTNGTTVTWAEGEWSVGPVIWIHATTQPEPEPDADDSPAVHTHRTGPADPPDGWRLSVRRARLSLSERWRREPRARAPPGDCPARAGLVKRALGEG